MRQATWHHALCAPNISTDAVCTLPNHRCRDKMLCTHRRLQRTPCSEATTLFRAVFWSLPYPFFTAPHLMYSPNHSPEGLFRALNWAPSRAAAGGYEPCCSSGVRSKVRLMSILRIGPILSRGGRYGTMLLQVGGAHTARASQSRRPQARTKGHVCRTMTSNSFGTRSVPLPGSHLAGSPKWQRRQGTRSIGA
jgi:hypothetical protein